MPLHDMSADGCAPQKEQIKKKSNSEHTRTRSGKIRVILDWRHAKSRREDDAGDVGFRTVPSEKVIQTAVLM
jgi:hypothetical protein